jgi:hypothetical protein
VGSITNNAAMEPMISLRKPSAEAIESFLNAQSKLDFTYRAVGATAATPPSGYNAGGQSGPAKLDSISPRLG